MILCLIIKIKLQFKKIQNPFAEIRLKKREQIENFFCQTAKKSTNQTMINLIMSEIQEFRLSATFCIAVMN